MIDPEWLPFIWFAIIGVLLAGYLILDGFDLGVGILHLLVTRTDHERRLSMNSIGPLWDGNEVWLVTFGGALFAMFPYAYATTFSAFYTAFILLLFALIFRAVSMEFRGKMQSPLGRAAWDCGFCLSSLLATFLFGVAGGNVIAGLALDNRGQYVGSLAEQLRPYPLVVGLLLVSLFALHGGLFLQLKVGGAMADRVRTATGISFLAFAALLIVVTTWTLFEVERATENFRDHPALWLLPLVGAIAVAFTGGMLWRQRPLLAFFGNALTIATLVGLLAAALFPNIINATDPSADLRIVDAASSSTTLTIGLLVVVIGMPFVLTYTAIIYWTFRGRTELGSHSY